VGRVAAVDTANRIAMFSGGSLAEGWACYVCDLMEEIGFLTPLERIAQQHTRARIAARAVADLSIHHGALTPPQAARLYVDRAHMSEAGSPRRGRAQHHVPRHGRDVLAGHPGLHRLRASMRLRQGERFRCARFTIACSPTERFP
jgi:uncharacterized protein (DUF885 family)